MTEPQVRPRDPPTETADADPTTMHASVYSAYGGPEMLRYTQVDRPEPADDEVLIQVVAASIGAGEDVTSQGPPQFR